MSLVLVEQNIDMALALSDRVVFIEHGRAGASESAPALRADRRLIDANLAL
jgi:ABC-type branched-subunit amino acid transport system ATPase component